MLSTARAIAWREIFARYRPPCYAFYFVVAFERFELRLTEKRSMETSREVCCAFCDRNDFAIGMSRPQHLQFVQKWGASRAEDGRFFSDGRTPHNQIWGPHFRVLRHWSLRDQSSTATTSCERHQSKVTLWNIYIHTHMDTYIHTYIHKWTSCMALNFKLWKTVELVIGPRSSLLFRGIPFNFIFEIFVERNVRRIRI